MRPVKDGSDVINRGGSRDEISETRFQCCTRSLRSFKHQTYSTNQGVALVAAEKHTV